MSNMTNWEKEAKQMLKAELARSGVRYTDLVSKLEAIGVKDTEGAIANKIARGKFSFVFFLQCMRAIGVTAVSVADRTPNKTVAE